MNGLNNAISTHSFFHEMKPEHLALLAQGASAAEFKAGEVLFREGEPAGQFFLIQSGSVTLEARKPKGGMDAVEIVGAGEVLGWSWLFPPFSWHYQARATTGVKVISLNGAHLLALAEENHDFGYELMKRVAQIVIHRLQAARRRVSGT